MSLIKVNYPTLSLIVFVLSVATLIPANANQLLIAAVKDQDTEAARKLIEQNVDVNASQADGATALHWAVHRDDLQTARMLINAGANVDKSNDFGIVPLALAARNRNAQMTKTLLKAGADPNTELLTGESLLMTAAHAGDLESVEALLKHGADVDTKEPVRQQTALMWALGEGHTDVARRLVESGADIYSKTTLGFTPLLFAARQGNLEATRFLLDADEDKGKKSDSAIKAAIGFFGGEDFVNTTANKMVSNTYLGGAGTAPASKKRVGLSALHVATLRGHVDVATLLLERGADPNYIGPGFSVLHWAVTSWETELNGANGIRAPEDHEWRNMAGIQEGKLELVQTLIDHGADINARLQKNPSRYGFTVASTRPKGATPYILAAYTGEADVMNLLVKNGADTTLTADDGIPTILYASGINRHRAENIASEDDSLAAVMATVKHGADVNSRDRAGNTAMHGAAWIRSPKLVQFLVDNGADVNVKNKAGLTPLYIADHNGRFAGQPPEIERLPVGHLLKELSVPAAVRQSVDDWPELPLHIRDAVETLLEGEFESKKDSKMK